MGEALTSKATKKNTTIYHRIIFTGRIKAVEDLIERFDICVLTTYTEGISNAIIEYMVHSKPVIATKGGGTEEIIEDRNTGFLIPPEDPEALVYKIEYLLSNPLIAKEMGQRGRDVINKKFTMNKLLDRTIKMYDALLRCKCKKKIANQ